MKKAEELKLYAPEPKRPELDAALCMSVAEGQGMGRYIEGKVLTVAVWDKKEKPLVVWRFFGDYWTGELRGNENPTKGELSPRQIEVKPCQCLTWRTEVPATKGESELLQNYFDDCRPGYLIGIVEDALSAHARAHCPDRQSVGEDLSVNRTKNELADYAWNPVTGCLKDCRYCYAKKSALRFASDWRRNLAERPKVQQVGANLFALDAPWETTNNRFLNNPTGFMPTIHKYRMDWPQKVKVGSTIMVCTDGDLFGPWVPEDWILQVFAAAEMAPQHQYIFLTQYPVRYQNLANHGVLPQKNNFWYGSTATILSDSVWANEKYNTFVAIEPLLGPFEGDATKTFRKLKWAVIGAETGKNAEKVIPKAGWIQDILTSADAAGTPVFMRSNMESIVGAENMRREKPAAFLQKIPTVEQKKRLWEHCTVCGKYRPMKEMYALLLRRKRGDNPERVAYMCPECYGKFSMKHFEKGEKEDEV